MSRLNLRGKIVEIDLYPLGSNRRLRRLRGKVKNIHSAQSIRDDESITIIVDGKEFEFPTDSEYFVINKVFDPKTNKQIGGRYGSKYLGGSLE